jgi:hypothetical protein
MFPKITIIVLLVCLAILPAIVGICLIRDAVRSMLTALESANTETDKIKLVRQSIHYRRLLQQYLTILGAIIGLATLATGTMRNVNIAAGRPESEYPLIIVFAYGLYYTMILALIYTPAHLSLADAGHRLRDRIFPLDSLESLKDDDEKRNKLDEILQLNLNTAQNLRGGIAILAPLLSSLFSSVLNMKL